MDESAQHEAQRARAKACENRGPIALPMGLAALLTLLAGCEPNWEVHRLPYELRGGWLGFDAMGSEVLVWGRDSCGHGALQGAIYDPAARSWRPAGLDGLAAIDPGRSAGRAATWTGDELVGLWLGGAEEGWRLRGLAYDPVGDAWRELPEDGMPVGDGGGRAVWTGEEVVIWGGGRPGHRDVVGSGAAYDPTTDTWRPMSMEGAPTARTSHAMVWTGTHVLVWGGVDERADDQGGEGPSRMRGDGASWDPITDTWRPITPIDSPPPQLVQNAVWTGSELLVAQGRNLVTADEAPVEASPAGAYDPTTDTWRPVSSDALHHHAEVIALDGEVYGLRGPRHDPLRSGAVRYDPEADRWQAHGPRGSTKRVGWVAEGPAVLDETHTVVAGCGGYLQAGCGYRRFVVFRP